MSVNKVILVGNVGKEVETKHLDGGSQVSNFSLATSENYTAKSGEKVTNTEWHNIVAWNKLSEICKKYVKKGQQIYLEGSIATRNYDDKDGVKRYITEIKATSIQLLGKKETQQEEQPQTTQFGTNLPPTEFPEPDKDDLPF